MPAETADPPAAPSISPFQAGLRAALNPPTEPAKEAAPPKPDAPKQDTPKEPVPAKAKTAKPEKAEPTPEAKTDTKAASRDMLFNKKGAKSEAEEVKPAEAAKSSVDAIAPPALKDEKSKAGWEALKTEAKQWESKAVQFERESAERKAAGRDTESLEARLAEREKKLADYEKVVARANVDLRPGYREKFIDGRNARATEARGIVEESGADVTKFDSAINLPEKQRSAMLREILSTMEPYDLTRINPILREIGQLDKEAEAIRAEPDKYLAADREREMREQAEAQANFAKDLHLTMAQSIRELRAELEVLNPVDGDDEWTSGAAGIEKKTSEFFDRDNSLKDQIKTVARAEAMPLYRKLYMDLRESSETKHAEQAAKIKDMEEELKAIHGKSPSLNGRGGGAPASDSERPYSEAFAARVRG